jgi:hypothetical protein
MAAMRPIVTFQQRLEKYRKQILFYGNRDVARMKPA